MKKTNNLICLAVAIVVAALVVWTVQKQKQTKLTEERLALQQQLEAQTQLGAQSQSAAGAAEPATAAPTSPTSSMAELVKLQAEVAAQEDQIASLKAGRATNPPSRTIRARPVTASADVLPRESWAFAGYTTPEAVFQSLFGAASQGDIKSLLACLTPEEAKRLMDEDFKGKPETDIGAEIAQEMTKGTGAQILNRSFPSEDEAVFTIFMGGQNDVIKMKLKRSGGEWKFDGEVKEK